LTRGKRDVNFTSTECEEVSYMKDPTAPEIKPIEPKPVTINTERSALLVLECSPHLDDPENFGAPLVPGITKLLDRARAAGILIVFTLPLPWKGKPHGQVYSGFKKRPCEPILFPPGHDKFAEGQLQSLLSLYDVNILLITGVKANMSVLYTATTAARRFNYDIIIPVDGIAATTDYEKEYTFYQLRAFPGGMPERFTFTKLDMISFQ
jgi:nicotinamidase-related amidase